VTLAELAILADIQQGEFVTVGDHVLQRDGINV
jgi:hypothetical protein